jgi:hypothetical protein
MLSTIKEWVKAKERPKWEQISNLSEAHKYYWIRYDSLQIIENILYHKWEHTHSKLQIVLPYSLKPMVLSQLHDSITGGHLGVRKTQSKIRDRYFWYHMSEDVKISCKKCDICESRKPPHKLPNAPLQKYLVGAPMERIAIDIMGPLPITTKRNSYLLVVGDYFSR